MGEMKDMLIIDGSYGEGGGQILRTAIALAALKKRSIKVINVRAKRRNPGLQPQHVAAVKAVARLCDASVSGVEIGSSQIEFEPKEIKREKLSIDVGTAGAISLILQALLLAACGSKKPIDIEFIGGTDVPWSPPIDYLRWITLYFMERYGYQVRIDLNRRGFYPRGGGRVKVNIQPSNLKRIELLQPGSLQRIFGISYAENRLRKSEVAERQKKASLDFLKDKFPDIPIALELEYSSAFSLGSGVVLVAEMGETRLGASILGERGKRAEAVGSETASILCKEVIAGASLDNHMADQIVPYLALAGGRVKVSQVTPHTMTNLEVVKKFGFNAVLRDNMLIA